MQSLCEYWNIERIAPKQRILSYNFLNAFALCLYQLTIKKGFPVAGKTLFDILFGLPL